MSSTFTTSSGYITLPITVDPNALIQQGIAAIQGELPGWIPVEGHIEMVLLEQFGAMSAQAANVAASASIAIFEYFGQLLGILPNTGAPATALSTWTMADASGYTVPAGAVVAYAGANGSQSLFSTTQEFSTTASSAGRTIAAAQLNLGSPLITDPAGSFTQADVFKSVEDGDIAIPRALQTVGVTTITSGSNNQTLPQSVINVASTTEFPTVGSLFVQDSNGYDIVAYTDTTPTSFTGCTGGTGIMSTGGNVYSLLEMPQSNIFVNSTSGFGTSGAFVIYTNTGTPGSPVFTPQLVSFTGVTPTAFTGCAGGTGYLWNGHHVDPYIESVQTVTEATLSVNAQQNETSDSVTLGPIDGTSIATGVPIQSQVSGSIYNNLPTGPLTLVLPNYSFVSGITATTVSSGGTDAETTQQYIDRLSQELQLLTPRPILPNDYAILAQSVDGVARATAYNNTYAGESFYANLTDGSTQITLAPATTIAAGSNGAILPQPIINVASTANFPPSGSAIVQTIDDFVTITYTGITGTSLIGCGGGTGTIALGDNISGSNFVFSTFDVGLSLYGPPGIPGEGTTMLETYLNPIQFLMSADATSTEIYSGVSILPDIDIEAAVAVSALDANGNPVSSSISAQIVALLSSLREVNFMVSYLQPTYKNIWVNYVVITQPGANTATVTAAVNAAVTAYLSPANWAGGNQTPPVWDTTVTSVYYLSLATVIESVAGVQSIQVVSGTPSLGLGSISNPAYGYNDVSLVSGISVSLPNLVSVSGAALVGT